MKKFLSVAIITIALLAAQKASTQTDVWDGTHTTWTNGSGTQSDPYLIENAEQLAHLAFIVNNGTGAGTDHTVGTDTYWKMTVNIDLNGSETFQWTPIGYYNSGYDFYIFGGHFDGDNHTVANLFINTATLQMIGLFGYTDGGSISNVGIISGSVTRQSVQLAVYAGGIAGYSASTISNCYNMGDVSSSSSFAYSNAGGIAGRSWSTISNCYNTGNVSSSSYAGGIAGSSNGAINNCYNTGNVSSSSDNYYSFSGGIAGDSGSTISNCYNTGNVSSSSYAGGIAGGSWSTISNCYNVGSITGDNKYGIAEDTVINSYYLLSCGATQGGIFKTEVFMKTQEFVDLLNATDIVYAMDEAPFINNAYPVFIWQTNGTATVAVINKSDVVSVFPNPANDLLNFSTPAKITNIEIFNIVGQIVYQSKYNDNEIGINISHFKSGSYTVKIYSTNNIITKQFIKN
ncbi:MAG: T9SS type A sorting domain-containing protein [Bacteroidales bacterium]|jgi:hypothetical protein|nr:T9SS type A sorting domain-containing protein [Bacteroidales bacterium]